MIDWSGWATFGLAATVTLTGTAVPIGGTTTGTTVDVAPAFNANGSVTFASTPGLDSAETIETVIQSVRRQT